MPDTSCDCRETPQSAGGRFADDLLLFVTGAILALLALSIFPGYPGPWAADGSGWVLPAGVAVVGGVAMKGFAVWRNRGFAA